MKHCLLNFLFICAACATAPQIKALKKPILFEIKKNGISHYIVGTIHIPLDVEKMYPSLYSLLDESAVFVSEVNTREIAAQTLDEMEEGQLYYKDTKEGTLEKDLSAGAYRMAVEKLFYITGNTLTTLKPKRARDLLEKYKKQGRSTFTRTTDRLKVSMPYLVLHKDGKLFDIQLEDYAIEKKKKLVALEEHHDLLINKCHQLRAVAEIEEMAVAEKANSTDQFLNEARAKLESCDLRERNEAWMKKLKPILEGNGRAFITVGMGHLGMGDFTLVSLLRADGYSVEFLDSER